MVPQDSERNFARVERALRDEIIEHYHSRGEAISDDAGLRTLDTNSTMVPQRAGLLLDLYEGRTGNRDVSGLRIADLGCGFGAIGLYLACAGATVVGIDPNAERLEVGAQLAERFALPASFQRGWIEALVLPDGEFDLAVLNNSLCYITEADDRRAALAGIRRILRPGGWLVLRDPSRSSPIDPFTGYPLVHRAPRLARPLLRRSDRGRNRSNVRLLSRRSARRALRRAGFTDIRIERRVPGRRPARYLHLTARRSAPAAEAERST